MFTKNPGYTNGSAMRPVHAAFLSLLFVACATNQTPTGKLDPDAYRHYGAGVAAGPTVDVQTVLASPASSVGKDVRIRGPVESVCQRKGCWMRVGSADNRLIVRFKDYGFFVPTDATGKEVVFEGTLTEQVQSVEEARHELEDEGKPEEARKITEPKRVYTFYATGVAIRK